MPRGAQEVKFGCPGSIIVIGFGKTRHNAGVIIISNFLLYHIILMGSEPSYCCVHENVQ